MIYFNPDPCIESKKGVLPPEFTGFAKNLSCTHRFSVHFLPIYNTGLWAQGVVLSL